MSAIASQMASLTIVYSIVYSGTDQRKHQSSASLAFVRGFTGDRWIPRTKGQLSGKCFHLMTSSCNLLLDVTWCVIRLCFAPPNWNTIQRHRNKDTLFFKPAYQFENDACKMTFSLCQVLISCTFIPLTSFRFHYRWWSRQKSTCYSWISSTWASKCRAKEASVLLAELSFWTKSRRIGEMTCLNAHVTSP